MYIIYTSVRCNMSQSSQSEPDGLRLWHSMIRPTPKWLRRSWKKAGDRALESLVATGNHWNHPHKWP